MDYLPRDQTPLHTLPFQARALHFLKKLTLRSRAGGGKLRDTNPPVIVPTQHFQRAHSSVDLLRKPDVSHLIGFRAEDGPSPMDTEDSFQDASTSTSSPHLRPRRHSTSDSLHNTPIHSALASYGATPASFRRQRDPGSKFLIDDAVKLLAPVPLLSQPNPIMQPPRLPVSDPEIQLQIGLSREAVHTLHDDTARPLEDVPLHDATLTGLTSSVSSSISPPIPSYPDALFGAHSLPVSQAVTSESSQEHLFSFSRPTGPLPPPFCLTTERGLRLSPSITARQPMPLSNLPNLPPPSPALATPSRKKVSLRSMPSLSIHGRGAVESQADHENEVSAGSDEDGSDDGDEEDEPPDALSVQQSDDEDDEPSVAGPSGIHNPGILREQRITDAGSLVERPASPTSLQDGHNIANFFCSETFVQAVRVVPPSTFLAAYPFSPDTSRIQDVSQHPLPGPDFLIPGARSESRSGLHHAASRSMVNLGSTPHTESALRRLTSREAMRSSAPSPSGYAAEGVAELEESDAEVVIGRLLRRISMPSFRPTLEPPPYPALSSRPKETVVSHEDEDRERLPPYSNSLYLIAIMPRKMEFSAPGVQAKDRKWRRVVCELEGTTFRVYKCPPGASGAGVLGDWWEKHVGVGDVASPGPPRARKSEEHFERPAKLGIDEPPTAVAPSASVTFGRHSRQRSGSQSSVASQSTTASTPRPAKRTSSASFLSPFRSSSAGEASRRRESRELERLPVGVRSSRSSLSQECSTGRMTPGQRSSLPAQPRSAPRHAFLPVATGRTPVRRGETPKPPDSDLLRAYTLQHAESGLGNDYLKRKNVIRVRLEGEQFLLQAPDVAAVVEWIEGLHAGTSIALDIDQRPMPRGPMFPRRRRRRARPTQGATGQRTLTSDSLG